MIVSEKNRAYVSHKSIQEQVRKHIEWLENELKELENDIGESIRESPDWRGKDKLLQSVPGIGPITSGVLLASLPELGLTETNLTIDFNHSCLWDNVTDS